METPLTAKDSEPHYTIGQVRKVMPTKVSPRTVAKWFDNGLLTGFKFPGSGDRRISKSSLLAFFEKRNLPVPPQLHGDRIVVYSLDTSISCRLPSQCFLATSPVEVGYHLAYGVSKILVDCSVGFADAEALVKMVYRSKIAKPYFLGVLAADQLPEHFEQLMPTCGGDVARVAQELAK